MWTKSRPIRYNTPMQPERKIHDIFVSRKLTLAVAESCTGGLVSHRITNVSGSSACFRGGVVAYSNKAKTLLLGVPEGIIKGHGAVSPRTASAMARGARQVFGSDVAVAITGIAGPAGGTRKKPVGLAYIAVATKRGVKVKRVKFTGSRLAVKRKFADEALLFIQETLH